MTPQHLHATANLWSLTAVWPQLAQAAQNAQDANGEDRGTVQAWRPGSGVYSGRTADSVLDAILKTSGERANPYQDRLDRAAATILWVAATLVPPGPAGPVEALAELEAGLGDATPQVALNVALWLGAEDRHIRKLLREPADHQALPGLRCPYCDTAGALAIRASGPPTRRVTVCTAGCTCDGDGCPCGMGATVEGLPHIWTYDQLGAALDAKDTA